MDVIKTSNYRLVSDGTRKGTKIFIGDVELTGIERIEFIADSNTFPVLHLSLINVNQKDPA